MHIETPTLPQAEEIFFHVQNAFGKDKLKTSTFKPHWIEAIELVKILQTSLCCAKAFSAPLGRRNGARALQSVGTTCLEPHERCYLFLILID